MGGTQRGERKVKKTPEMREQERTRSMCHKRRGEVVELFLFKRQQELTATSLARSSGMYTGSQDLLGVPLY
jgi:hypothetical protein